MADAELRMRSTAGRGTLAAAVLASGMAFLDSTVVNVALPKLGTDLGASMAQLQWVVNGYTLTLAAFVLLGGALGDRFGRRRVFLIGVLWFTLASIACGSSPTIEVLVVARIVQGVGAALLTPGSLALLQSSFHPDDRGRAIGAWSGLAGVTTAIGPFVGGLLIDHGSWRWIFWMNVPLAVVAVWLCLTYVPESRDEQASVRFDVLGAVLGAVALAGLTYALIAWPEDGFGSPRVLLGLAAAVAGGVAFVLVERDKGDAAMMPLRLYESRTFSALNLYTLVVYGAFGGLFFLLVIYLQTVAGFSAFTTGLATLPMTLLMLAFSARSGALATRIGPRLQLAAGPLCCAAGILLLRQVGPSPNYWTDIFPGVMIFGIGLTLFVAPLTATVLGAVATHYAGVASGINNTAARAGSLLAVATLPLLVGLSGAEYAQPGPLTESFRAACLWCAGVLVVGALVAAVFLPRSTRCPKVDLVPDVGLSHRQSRDRVSSTKS